MLLINLLALLLMVPGNDSTTFVDAPWEWTMEESGACRGSAEMVLFGQPQSISVVKYPESLMSTSVAYASGEFCTTVDSVAMACNASVALNGSYFNVRSHVSTVMLCMDGEMITGSAKNEAEGRSDGVVCFDREGRISIFPYSKAIEDSLRVSFKSAMASGPLLIDDGMERPFKDVSFNTARHPRTMIGVTEDRTVVYVVVDGRFAGKAAGATIPEMAKIARYLGLRYAINLDGGGSCTVWTRDAGVLNHPSDNHIWDHAGLRRDPTVIIARKKPE